jgi:hypothetical protein
VLRTNPLSSGRDVLAALARLHLHRCLTHRLEGLQFFMSPVAVPVVVSLFHSRHGAVAYAARRWARIVAAVRLLSEDPRTLEGWSRAVGVSRGALKMWCQVAGVTAKDSLDLARLLRGAEFSHERPRNPFDVFDIVDPRTFTRLLIRADLSAMPRLPPPLALLTAQKL